MGKGQTQTAKLSQSEDSQTPSEGTPKVDLAFGVPKEDQKATKRSVGRPSKLLPIELRLDVATEEFLLAVISGEDISQSGSTGKRYRAPAGLAVRTKASELWISRFTRARYEPERRQPFTFAS